jgi:hypothetical protein
MREAEFCESNSSKAYKYRSDDQDTEASKLQCLWEHGLSLVLRWVPKLASLGVARGDIFKKGIDIQDLLRV